MAREAQHSGGGRTGASGFTLIELMVVVAVVAVIAAIAVPGYRQYATRGRLADAHSQLAAFGANLQQYYQDNRTYVGACGTSGLGALPAPPNSLFTYACPSANLTTTGFLATATGKSGTAVTGFVFTLNERGERATTAAPKGWVSSSTCWVLSSSGVCQ